MSVSAEPRDPVGGQVAAPDDEKSHPEHDRRWLPLLIRQGLLLIVAGIEKELGIDRKPR